MDKRIGSPADKAGMVRYLGRGERVSPTDAYIEAELQDIGMGGPGCAAPEDYTMTTVPEGYRGVVFKKNGHVMFKFLIRGPA